MILTRKRLSEMSEESGVWKAIAAFGNRFDQSVLHGTRILFAPPVARDAEQKVIADLSYGSSIRNRIDIYPSHEVDSPVLLFVHGGGFVTGDKNVTREFYRNVGLHFSDHGFTVALMNYRLAPQDSWPAASDDIAAAMLWLRGNAADFGGSPDKIFLFGHSAGATHAAGFLFGTRYQETASLLSGALLLSGIYFIEAPLFDGRLAYFGGDPERYRERSPGNGCMPDNVPIWIGHAELDLQEFGEQASRLFQSIANRSRHATLQQTCRFHNHVSTVFSLGMDYGTVGEQITQFILSVMESR